MHKIEEILLGIERTSLGGNLFIKLADIERSSDLYDLALKMTKKMDLEVNWDGLNNIVKELHSLLFELWEDINNFYDFSLSLERFIDILVKKSFLNSYPLNVRMAEKIFSIKEELSNASFNKEVFPKEDIFKIFDNRFWVFY